MALEKQVASDHYAFSTYMSKGRWCSVWHQLNELQKVVPATILEVGHGPGLLKAAAGCFGWKVETLDLDPDLRPDHVGSVTSLPFGAGSFDVVCAFQVLEHFPYEVSVQAFAEMRRVASRYVIISLPDAQQVWRYQIHIPRIRTIDVLVPKPRFRPPLHMPDREHFWEINKRGYPVRRIVDDFGKFARLDRTYRVRENPYHRFFVFSC